MVKENKEEMAFIWFWRFIFAVLVIAVILGYLERDDWGDNYKPDPAEENVRLTPEQYQEQLEEDYEPHYGR